MSNMRYCRFEDTLHDLQDCNEHMFDPDLSETEEKARTDLIELCKDITEEQYGDVE